MRKIVIGVANVGTRSVKVDSHAHFHDVDDILQFERAQTHGYRLNLASGTGTRFKPGETRTVELIDYSDSMDSYGVKTKRPGRSSCC